MRARVAALACLPWIAANAVAGPDDVVPRGDILYDLLARTAARGGLPGWRRADFLRADRLYTREELTRIARAATGDDPALAAARRELGLTTTAVRALVAGQGAVQARTGPPAGETTLRLAGILPVGRDGYAVAMAGRFRSELSAGGYPAIETLYVVVPGRVLDIELGRRPRRWGAAATGGMALSDDAPATTGLLLQKNFRLPGRWGRRLGQWHFEQFHGQFFENDDPRAPANARGTRRDLGFRRLEAMAGDRWRFSYQEAFKATRLPDRHWMPALPWYVYQHDWTAGASGSWLGLPGSGKQPNSAWFNFAAVLAGSYRVDRRASRVFGELLLDDLEAPGGLGKGDEVPRRTGLLLGGFWPDLCGDGGSLALRAETVRIDPGTFRSEFSPMFWSQGNRPLGFPTGANARLHFLRIDWRPGGPDAFALEGAVRRPARAEDASPRSDRMEAHWVHTLDRNAFVIARIRWNRQAADRSTRHQTRLEIGYGAGW